MASRFTRGAKVYTQDGRSYRVDEVEGDRVYCTSDGGAETEFGAETLLTESEWSAKTGGRRDLFYTRLKQSRPYTSATLGKIEAVTAEALLKKVERLSPGILDFAAFSAAEQAMGENGDGDLVSGLSIAKCRTVFDSAGADVRVSLLATLLGIPIEALADAGRLGDNLMRALIEKGLAPRSEAFEEFLDRPRR